MENFEDDFDDEMEDDFNDKKSESWKPIYALNKELSSIAQKISDTLQSMLELIGEEDERSKSSLEMMVGDSLLVRAKLSGAKAADMYQMYMENGSIIRSRMREMKAFTYGLEMDNNFGEGTGIEEKYILLLREEVEQFRATFIEWVKTFEKDEFEDEWGMY